MPPIQWVPVLFQVVTWPGFAVDHIPNFSTEFKVRVKIHIFPSLELRGLFNVKFSLYLYLNLKKSFIVKLPTNYLLYLNRTALPAD